MDGGDKLVAVLRMNLKVVRNLVAVTKELVVYVGEVDDEATGKEECSATPKSSEEPSIGLEVIPVAEAVEDNTSGSMKLAL